MPQQMTERQIIELEELLTPKTSKYNPHIPTPRQAAFLLLNNREAMYGGAAGGGKSDALLMAALQYVDVPGYSALLLRRTFQDLALPGALMDRLGEWLGPYVEAREVRWIDKEKTYVFPSGATVTFGYLEAEKDKYRYQSAEFQFIGFDELTQFTETQYRYMFSRLRKLKEADIPLRMRSATNPDGPGLQWVKNRFIVPNTPGTTGTTGKPTIKNHRVFIPAKLEDNPYLDQEEYELSLSELDPLTRARLRHGNWEIKEVGALFHKDWFPIIQKEDLPEKLKLVRYWDFAGTDEEKAKRDKGDPDYTAGVLIGEAKGIYYIIDVKRKRLSPEATEILILQTAIEDGPKTSIYIEEEPGSAGKHMIDHYARNILKGYALRGNRETGSKVLRANPMSSAAERGNVRLVEAHWNDEFLDELVMFPTKGFHDDQVDAASGAMKMLRSKIHVDSLPVDLVSDGISYWRAN